MRKLHFRVDVSTAKQLNVNNLSVLSQLSSSLFYDEIIVLCFTFYNVETSAANNKFANIYPIPPGSLQLFADNDYDTATDPVFITEKRETNTGVNLPGDWLYDGTADPEQGQLSFRVNTLTARAKEVLALENAKPKDNVQLTLTIQQPVSAVETVVFLKLGLTFANRPLLSDGVLPPPPTPSGDYYTIDQINGILMSGTDIQFSEDGAAWEETQTVKSIFWRYRYKNIENAWSDPIGIINGQFVNGVPAYMVTPSAGVNSVPMSNLGVLSPTVVQIFDNTGAQRNDLAIMWLTDSVQFTVPGSEIISGAWAIRLGGGSTLAPDTINGPDCTPLQYDGARYYYALDNRFDTLQFVDSYDRISLVSCTVVSADQTVRGNVVLKVYLNNTLLATRVVEAGMELRYVFQTPTDGTIKIVRDVFNAEDTLKVGGAVISAEVKYLKIRIAK